MLTKAEKLIPWATFALLFCLYGYSLPTHLTEGDSGEWMMIARFGGVPHPSGYPLYAFLIQVFYRVFPFFPVVTRVALLSSLSAAFAGFFLIKVLFQYRIPVHIAFFTVITIMTSSVVWRVANMTEPFALNLLIVCALIYYSSYGIGMRGTQKYINILIVGMCIGLGFCNHHSLVWVVPFSLIIFINRKGFFKKVRYLIWGGLLGLIPLLYFVYSRNSPSPYDYYSLHGFNDLVHLLFRSQYGTFTMVPTSRGEWWEVPEYFLAHLPGWLSWIFGIFAIHGVTLIFIKLWKNFKVNAVLIYWPLVFLLSSFVFFSLFKLKIVSLVPTIIERFMALPVILLALPISLSLFEIYSFIKQRCESCSRAFYLSCAVILTLHVGMQNRMADRSKDFFYEEHVNAILSLAKAASISVIAHASDSESFGLEYGKYILKEGKAVPWDVALNRWQGSMVYRNKLMKMGLIPESALTAQTSQMMSLLLDRFQQVLVLDLPLKPLPKLFEHGYPLGSGFLLLAPNFALPSPQQILQNNILFYQNHAYIPPCDEVKNMSAWNREIYDKYVENINALMRHYDKENVPEVSILMSIQQKYMACL